jgi:hypothetical protein
LRGHSRAETAKPRLSKESAKFPEPRADSHAPSININGNRSLSVLVLATRRLMVG